MPFLKDCTTKSTSRAAAVPDRRAHHLTSRPEASQVAEQNNGPQRWEKRRIPTLGPCIPDLESINLNYSHAVPKGQGRRRHIHVTVNHLYLARGIYCQAHIFARRASRPGMCGLAYIDECRVGSGIFTRRRAFIAFYGPRRTSVYEYSVWPALPIAAAEEWSTPMKARPRGRRVAPQAWNDAPYDQMGSLHT